MVSFSLCIHAVDYTKKMWFTEFFLCIDIERHFCNIRATLINWKIFAPNLYSKLVPILSESSINIKTGSIPKLKKKTF